MAKKPTAAPRRFPFVLRALFFAAIYTAIATGIDVAAQLQQTGTAQTWDWERTYRYFLIGLVVASATLLFFRLRKPRINR